VSESGEFFITARSTFKTLQDLVIHYQRDADGLCINLRKPCVITTDILGEPIDEWQIDRSGIRLVMKLMSGQFTEMWGGIWNATTPVAVMTLIPNQNMNVEDFLLLANLMKKLRHPNLVQLYNLCSKEEPVLIITELMKHGSCLEYLCGEGKSLKHPQLVHMAAQVASGMTYLEEQNIIHRDLAARNILVGEGILCKVANFELAQVMDRNFYKIQKQGKIAIKWAAPEAALLNRFSIKSDVWSFGIVLYEIITYGKPPYLGMTDDDVKQQIQQGYCMPPPGGCPGKLYDIMLNCWRVEPANRPNFETLQQQLADFFYSTD
jgi:fyn-related kinase